MSKNAKLFNRDFDCYKVGGKVTASGSVFPRKDHHEDGDAAGRHIRITYCTGVEKCGSVLPKVTVLGDCPVTDSLLSHE